MTGKELASLAQDALGALEPGTEFGLSDLLPPELWSGTPVGVRRSAGTAFLATMKRSEAVSCLGRDGENHQRYRKLG